MGVIGMIVANIIPWIHVNAARVTESLIFTVSLALCLLGMRNVKKQIRYYRSGLFIHSAKYGAGDSVRDVSGFLKQKIAKGHRRIPVTNGLLDGAEDPCPNTPKVLIVEYSRLGPREKKTIHENPPSMPPEILDLS